MNQAVTTRPRTREQVVSYAQQELENQNLLYLEIPLPCEFDGQLEHTMRVIARENKVTLRHDAGYVLLSRT